MGKDKRKGQKKGSTADYITGSGNIGDMMDRYGVAGVNFGGKPGNSMNRTVRLPDDVDKEIADKMMNDYDTRRGMEAAAMAGNKDAQKFAKKGFKAGNIYSAYDTMKDLKKEYVGGGGMRGPKNEAGLTHALVNADRDALNSSIDNRFDAMSVEEQEKDKGFTYNGADKEISPEMQAAKDRVTAYSANSSGGQSAPSPYAASFGADDQQSDTSMVADSADPKSAGGYLDAFKNKLKEERNLKPDF